MEITLYVSILHLIVVISGKSTGPGDNVDIVRSTDTGLVNLGPPHSIGNPVTTYVPDHPRAVFLRDLKIAGSEWICSCDGIGYVFFRIVLLGTNHIT